MRAYVIRADGDTLFVANYEDDEYTGDADRLPPYVRACVTLFHSRESTAHGTPYSLEQGDLTWAYSFFESFAVVLLITSDEEMSGIRRRMVSLGNEIARSYSSVITSWSGSIGEIYEVNELVDKYMRLDLTQPSETKLSKIQQIVDKALEEYDIAFAGVLDATGTMITGNIPETHLSYIQTKIADGAIKSSVDIVPTAVEIRGYNIQILKVQSLTVATASHRDGNRVTATQAASEIGQNLDEAIN